jgi:hypothetical protein
MSEHQFDAKAVFEQARAFGRAEGMAIMLTRILNESQDKIRFFVNEIKTRKHDNELAMAVGIVMKRQTDSLHEQHAEIVAGIEERTPAIITLMRALGVEVEFEDEPPTGKE